jgi:hypothetical protein
MIKQYNSATVEKDLRAKIQGFQARASALKKEHSVKAQAIRQDGRLTPQAKQDDLAKLVEQTNDAIRAIKDEQRAYVNRVQSDIEHVVRGSQPADVNSVMLRRDAADRARRIASEADAIVMLNDAARSGDESLAHAVGFRARNSGWTDALEVYRVVQPTGAENATALAAVENLSTDVGYNLSNQISYAEVSTSS